MITRLWYAGRQPGSKCEDQKEDILVQYSPPPPPPPLSPPALSWKQGEERRSHRSVKHRETFPEKLSEVLG